MARRLSSSVRFLGTSGYQISVVDLSIKNRKHDLALLTYPHGAISFSRLWASPQYDNTNVLIESLDVDTKRSSGSTPSHR